MVVHLIKELRILVYVYLTTTWVYDLSQRGKGRVYYQNNRKTVGRFWALLSHVIAGSRYLDDEEQQGSQEGKRPFSLAFASSSPSLNHSLLQIYYYIYIYIYILSLQIYEYRNAFLCHLAV